MKALLLIIAVMSVVGGFAADVNAATPCARQRVAMRAACQKIKGVKMTPGRANICKNKTAAYNRCLSKEAKRVAEQDSCFELYAPVCALTPGGAALGFANPCYAALVGATILHDGECLSTK